MIPALEMCRLAQAAYTDPAAWARGDAYATRTDVGDLTIVTFRGTRPEDLEAWLIDLASFAVRLDPVFGPIAASFDDEVLGVAGQIISDLAGRRAALCGHSMGGAEAHNMAARVIAAGIPVDQVETFGSANAGAFNGVLRAIPGCDWRHRDDPVPFLPPDIDRPRLLQQVVPPRFEIDFVADHFVEEYLAALAAIG